MKGHWNPSLQAAAFRLRRYRARGLSSLLPVARHGAEDKDGVRGDHADLVSVGIADVFGTTRADEALVEALLRTVATQGVDRVRAIVDQRDPDTIAMLESISAADGVCLRGR